MYQTLNQFAEIGRIASTHGLEGHVNFVHNLKGKKPFKDIKFLFIEMKRGSNIPFKIKNIRPSSDTDAILAIEGIDTLEQAKTIAGKKVSLPQEQYEQVQPKDVTMNFVGFTLYDAKDKKVGIIKEVFESPGQLLASIELENGNEALVPMVESWILGINMNSKELYIQLPDGLIEVYL